MRVSKRASLREIHVRAPYNAPLKCLNMRWEHLLFDSKIIASIPYPYFGMFQVFPKISVIDDSQHFNSVHIRRSKNIVQTSWTFYYAGQNNKVSLRLVSTLYLNILLQDQYGEVWDPEQRYKPCRRRLAKRYQPCRFAPWKICDKQSVKVDNLALLFIPSNQDN